MALMSLRGYAEWRKQHGLPGGTLRAVQKALAAGRIKKNADGKIDSGAADIDWAANTDEGQRRDPALPPSGDGQPATTAAAAAPKGKEKTGAGSTQPRHESPFQKNRAQREQWEAKLKQAQYEQLMGQLVPLESAQQEWAKMVMAAKNRLLALPVEFKGKCPDATKAHLVALEALLRKALEELAEWPKR